MKIDVNVNLARWPFRRLPCEELDNLVSRLRRCEVGQAWVGSFEGLFYRDISGVNSRLERQCAQDGQGLLVPFGTINPMLSQWRQDLQRCHELYRMRGIRLHPNYHGYGLDDPAFTALLDEAAERDLIVQLAVSMDDARSHHPMMKVPDVDVRPLVDVVPRHKNLHLMLLGALHSVPASLLARLAAAGNVYFDVSMLGDQAEIATATAGLPRKRLVFGSLFPLAELETAAENVDALDWPESDRHALARENARQLMECAAESG